MHFPESFREMLDGLLLGDGRLVNETFLLRQAERHRAWVDQVERAFWSVGIPCARRGPRLWTSPNPELGRERLRWQTLPLDIRITPTSLAHWFAGAGIRTNRGYALRFSMPRSSRDELEFLCQRLREVYGWRPAVFRNKKAWAIRVARSDDRVALAALIRPHLPDCFQLTVRASRPRRSRPKPQRANASPRYLTRTELADVLLSLLRGESQSSIARRHGISQPRVCWMKKRFLT